MFAIIYFTSDLHLCHNKNFLYEPRGFDSIEEMNQAILDRWNSTVQKEDVVYILGDLMLNDNEQALNILKQLNGNIYIIRGNHDTDKRLNLYSELPNVINIWEAKYFNYGKYHFYLSHFPSITSNIEKEKLTQITINLHGHTHSKEKFFNNNFFMYNVAMDAHDCTPVSIDTIIQDIKAKMREDNTCKYYRFEYGKGHCYGTKDCEVCYCNGDKRHCSEN